MRNPAEPGCALGNPVVAGATTQSPAVEAEDLVRRFGDVTALAHVSLTVQRGEFFSLLGPSGCGKTTLLRLIAGLDWPDSGHLRIAGVDALDLPAHRRPVNTVFQSYALFPHLDVWNNVAFGLRMKRVPRDALRSRVNQALELVQITDLAGRRPAQLSGGQRQRVALARAVVNEPSVLLLDEPLGALDLQLRRQLQVELRALQRRLGMTFIHVTHDQDEALVLSDRVAVMQTGRVVQLGEPAELYSRPRTRFVAGFLGECNLLTGESVAQTGRVGGPELLVQTDIGRLRISDATARASQPIPPTITLAIRPERLRLSNAEHGPGPNQVPGVVREVVYSGPETRFLLDATGTNLRARVMNRDHAPGEFRAGQRVLVELPAEALVLLDD